MTREGCFDPLGLCGLSSSNEGTKALLGFTTCSFEFLLRRNDLVFLFGEQCYPLTYIPCKCKNHSIFFGNDCILEYFHEKGLYLSVLLAYKK